MATEETNKDAREFQEETRAHRLAKLDALRERGIEPYPVRFDRDSTAAAIREEFGEIGPGTDTGRVVHIAGRIMGERRHGGLDFAVNNAGLDSHHRQLEQMTLDEFERVVHVNLAGTFLCMKYELPALRRREGGAIVNIASNGGLYAIPTAPAYVAAKHGIVGLTKVAAVDYAPDRIRVNAVSPGVILTPFHERFSTPEQVAAQTATIPLGRAGAVEDCVGAYLFLLSEALSGYVTGQILEVNGGQLMP